MPAVQDDQSHPFEDTRMNARNDVIADVVMRGVSPPGEYIRVAEDFFGEAVVGFSEGGGSDGFDTVFSQRLGKGAVNTIRIDLGDLGLGSLVDKLVPDGDTKGRHVGRRAERGRGENQKRIHM